MFPHKCRIKPVWQMVPFLVPFQINWTINANTKYKLFKWFIVTPLRSSKRAKAIFSPFVFCCFFWSNDRRENEEIWEGMWARECERKGRGREGWRKRKLAIYYLFLCAAATNATVAVKQLGIALNCGTMMMWNGKCEKRWVRLHEWNHINEDTYGLHERGVGWKETGEK